MKKELTYDKAYEKLEQLIEELEDGDVKLDKLTTKVKEANELIAICENKLRKIEGDIDKISAHSTPD
ncbi:MAG TPA: exodeoxyribonuclease VII small subunit [Chitinophagales bacterium]|nr:exodeoxyribonuclease VII small subunit [Chitinophagales bacterium]